MQTDGPNADGFCYWVQQQGRILQNIRFRFPRRQSDCLAEEQISHLECTHDALIRMGSIKESAASSISIDLLQVVYLQNFPLRCCYFQLITLGIRS